MVLIYLTLIQINVWIKNTYKNIQIILLNLKKKKILLKIYWY